MLLIFAKPTLDGGLLLITCFLYLKSSFPKGVRSILESSEKNDVFNYPC